MIFVGLNDSQKKAEISNYVKKHEIKNVLVLSPQKYFLDLSGFDFPIRQIEYNETIMYRTFYPLLEEINDGYLVVFNEFLRTTKRTDLVYNCCAKYTNQTPHRLVFEYLPIISSQSDIMILLDFDTSQRYKGRGIKDIDMSDHSIQMVRRNYSLTGILLNVPSEAESEYRAKAENLFENIGKHDPDTIPRHLHSWCNKYRRGYITKHPDDMFLAGCPSGYKLPNVLSRKNATRGEYILADLPFARLEWNDLLRDTGMESMLYLKTTFKVDEVYESMFNDWVKDVEALYAKTSIYTGNS